MRKQQLFQYLQNLWFYTNFPFHNVDRSRWESFARSLKESYPLIKDKQQLLPQLYATIARCPATMQSGRLQQPKMKNVRPTFDSFEQEYPSFRYLSRIRFHAQRHRLLACFFLANDLYPCTLYRFIVRPWPGPRYLRSTF